MNAQPTICLTFDDCDPSGWTNAIPLFAKYHAHATFSFSGAITPVVIDCMHHLSAAGHTIGLHTLHHADAPEYLQAHGPQAYFDDEIKPQLEAVQAAGITCGTFAFPNNKYNLETLKLLRPYFHHFRSGYTKEYQDICFVPLDWLQPQPGGLQEQLDTTLSNLDAATDHKVFSPSIFQTIAPYVLHGRGIGEYYHSRLEDELAAIDRAVVNRECLVIYSHGIAPHAQGVNMPLELLTALLEHAAAKNCRLIGFDELPR